MQTLGVPGLGLAVDEQVAFLAELLVALGVVVCGHGLGDADCCGDAGGYG